MQYKNFLSAALLGLAFTSEVAAQAAAAGGAGGGAAAGGANAAATLDPAAVQTGSAQDGTKASGAVSGQAASATDSANFINFCKGKTLTNGLQTAGGSCNGVVMGDIPSSDNMVSTIITNPQNGQDLLPNTQFSFEAISSNMVFGAFTNAQATYYSAPQALDKATGNIIGHLHFSVQAISDVNVKTPLDPKTFAFFKGVDDNGNGAGTLKALVKDGLKPGNYRVCTITSAANHQPVVMPVAK